MLSSPWLLLDKCIPTKHLGGASAADKRLSLLDRLIACLPITLLVLALFAVKADASDPSFPPLTGRVVDDAHILSPQANDQMNSMLAQHEQKTGEQIVVATIKSLQGFPIEDYGYRLGRYWRIGQKKQNNGAILLVVPSEHKVRIEVGYGLEGYLTDAQCKIIIEDIILPQFRKGDFDTGVQAGVAAILRVLGGEHLTEEAPAQTEDLPYISVWFLLILVIFVLIFFNFSRYGAGPRTRRSTGRFPGGMGSWPSGSDSGGFFGGGGSFGGGGASGSW